MDLLTLKNNIRRQYAFDAAILMEGGRLENRANNTQKKLCEELNTNLYTHFDLKYGTQFSITDSPADVGSKRLRTMWTFEAAYDGDYRYASQIHNELVHNLTEDIFKEFTEMVDPYEIEKIEFYIIAMCSGIVINPNTFEPMLGFISRYRIIMPEISL